MNLNLENISLFDAAAATSGVAVTSYGLGQLSGVTYTVPAHGEITVDFEIKLMCITPDNVNTLNALIRGLLEASKRHLYDELEKTSVSGGVSFFGFFSGGIKASYEKTKHTMESYGLSEENQRTIVNAMMKLSQEMSTFKYKGTIHNKDYDYSVSGNLFGFVMDCTIKQGSIENQMRFLGRNVHLRDSVGGPTLPVIEKLY